MKKARGMAGAMAALGIMLMMLAAYAVLLAGFSQQYRQEAVGRADEQFRSRIFRLRAYASALPPLDYSNDTLPLNWMLRLRPWLVIHTVSGYGSEILDIRAVSRGGRLAVVREALMQLPPPCIAFPLDMLNPAWDRLSVFNASVEKLLLHTREGVYETVTAMPAAEEFKPCDTPPLPESYRLVIHHEGIAMSYRVTEGSCVEEQRREDVTELECSPLSVVRLEPRGVMSGWRSGDEAAPPGNATIVVDSGYIINATGGEVDEG